MFLKNRRMDDGRWDRILSALTSRHRRQLLVALYSPGDDGDVDPLQTVDSSNTDRLETPLVHTHLPKLEESGFISWDTDRGMISEGPDWDEIAPLIELIESNRDDLPDGWP